MPSGSSTDVGWSGARQGVGRATWGQETMWHVHRSMHDTAHLNQSGVVAVPEGVTLDGVVDAIRELLIHHESLRTSLSWRGGALWQSLPGCGSIPVRVHEAEEEPRDRAAAGLHRELFDVEGDHLVRFAVLTLAGVPASVEWSACHAVCDGVSVNIINSHLAATLNAAERGTTSPPAIQPLELAAFEQSENGRRLDLRAQRHWETTLESFPTYPRPASPHESRFRRGRLRSSLARTSAETISGHLRISTSAVVLTAMCVALERVVQTGRVGLQLTSCNRFRPDLRDAVGNLTQTGVLVHQVAGIPFVQLAPGIAAASIRAYANASYDFPAVQGLVEQASRRSGGLDVGVIFDDMRLTQPSVRPAHPPPGGSTSGSAVESEFTWIPDIEHENTSLILFLYDAPDSYVLVVQFNTERYSARAVEDLMWSMEEVLHREATALSGG